MKYFKLSMDLKRKNDIVCHYLTDYGIGLNSFSVGKECLQWDERFEFYYDKKEGDIVSDYIANDKGWFVVTKKLKNIMETMNTNIQYIPVTIKEKNSKSALLDCYIANILMQVDAICLEKSKYVTISSSKTGDIQVISKYAIFSNKTQNADIFKLMGFSANAIFTSEKFKNEITHHHITGIAFTEVIAVE